MRFRGSCVAVAAQTYKVFILEDNPLMRRMLKDFIDHEEDLRVVGEAASAEAALERVFEADLLLVDLSLPGMSGLEFLQRYRTKAGAGRCLVISAHAEPFYKTAALEAGAIGFVTKGDPDEILGAVRAALQGVA